MKEEKTELIEFTEIERNYLLNWITFTFDFLPYAKPEDEDEEDENEENKDKPLTKKELDFFRKSLEAAKKLSDFCLQLVDSLKCTISKELENILWERAKDNHNFDRTIREASENNKPEFDELISQLGQLGVSDEKMMESDEKIYSMFIDKFTLIKTL